MRTFLLVFLIIPLFTSCALLYNPTQKLLAEKEFDMLESLASKAREEKRVLDNANWKIDEFYNDLVPHSGGTPHSEYQKTIRLLTQWKTAKPESPTPRIALAKIYKDYAWKARGRGWAHTVTREGWKLFQQRLRVAAKELRSPVTKYDPVRYSTMLIVIRGLGRQGEQAKEKKIAYRWFREGAELFPGYYPLYFQMAVLLTVRWGGEPGEWENFVKEYGEKSEEIDGERLRQLMCQKIRGLASC